MTIRFDMELEDLMAFQKHFLATNSQLKKQILTLRSIFFIGGAVFIWLVYLIVSAGYPLWDVIPIVLLLLGILWFALGLLSPKWLRAYYAKRAQAQYGTGAAGSNLFGTTEMTFDKDGYTVDRNGTEGQTEWSLVVDVAETPDYFFIYVSDIAANTIPKRKLAEKEVKELGEIFAKYVAPKKAAK